MAYTPTVRTSGYRSASPVYSGQGARTSSHSLNTFKNLEQENYARMHKGATPNPSADATLPTFSTRSASGSIQQGIQQNTISTAYSDPRKFGETGSYISAKGASNIIDSISKAWSERKDANRVSEFAFTPDTT